MLLKTQAWGLFGVWICLQASLIGLTRAAETPPTPAASERLEFSGSAKGALLPALGRGRSLNDLDALSPGSSLGAVISRSPGAGVGALSAPPQRNAPRAARTDRGWSSLESQDIDPARAAEIAAGVRDPDAYLKQISRNYPDRRGSGPANSSNKNRTAADTGTSSDISLSGDLSRAQSSGSLNPIFDARAGDLGRSAFPASSRSTTGDAASFGGIPGAPSPQANENPVSPASSVFRLGEPAAPRSVRDLIGLQDSQDLRTLDRSLFPVLGARDLTREEINPIKPLSAGQDSSRSTARRRSTDPFDTAAGLSSQYPYGSSPSPLRELMTRIQGPASSSGSSSPYQLPQTTRSSSHPGPADLPTRPF